MVNETFYKTKSFLFVGTISFMMGFISFHFISKNINTVTLLYTEVSNTGEIRPIKTGEIKTWQTSTTGIVNISKVWWPNRSNKSQSSVWKEPTNTGTIVHLWFKTWDIRQKYVQYTYKLWGMREVIRNECENGSWNITTRWDSGKAVGLCQMNERFHKLPALYYTSWQTQVEYCHQKTEWWTKFYWPDRPLYNKKTGKYIWLCKDIVKSRFIFK